MEDLKIKYKHFFKVIAIFLTLGIESNLGLVRTAQAQNYMTDYYFLYHIGEYAYSPSASADHDLSVGSQYEYFSMEYLATAYFEIKFDIKVVKGTGTKDLEIILSARNNLGDYEIEDNDTFIYYIGDDAYSSGMSSYDTIGTNTNDDIEIPAFTALFLIAAFEDSYWEYYTWAGSKIEEITVSLFASSASTSHILKIKKYRFEDNTGNAHDDSQDFSDYNSLSDVDWDNLSGTLTLNKSDDTLYLYVPQTLSYITVASDHDLSIESEYENFSIKYLATAYFEIKFDIEAAKEGGGTKDVEIILSADNDLGDYEAEDNDTFIYYIGDGAYFPCMSSYDTIGTSSRDDVEIPTFTELFILAVFENADWGDYTWAGSEIQKITFALVAGSSSATNVFKIKEYAFEDITGDDSDDSQDFSDYYSLSDADWTVLGGAPIVNTYDDTLYLRSFFLAQYEAYYTQYGYYPEIPLGTEEICDGYDSNWDGIIPENEADEDGDGFMICEGDCDDSDDTVYPGASGTYNGKDNDCNGVIDNDEKLPSSSTYVTVAADHDLSVESDYEYFSIEYRATSYFEIKFDIEAAKVGGGTEDVEIILSADNDLGDYEAEDEDTFIYYIGDDAYSSSMSYYDTIGALYDDDIEIPTFTALFTLAALEDTDWGDYTWAGSEIEKITLILVASFTSTTNILKIKEYTFEDGFGDIHDDSQDFGDYDSLSDAGWDSLGGAPVVNTSDDTLHLRSSYFAQYEAYYAQYGTYPYTGYDPGYSGYSGSYYSYQGAEEICDGYDNDWDGIIPVNEADDDGDGFMICEGDCDDSDDTVYPGASGTYKGKDNNCNGIIDKDEKKRPSYPTYTSIFPSQTQYQQLWKLSLLPAYLEQQKQNLYYNQLNFYEQVLIKTLYSGGEFWPLFAQPYWYQPNFPYWSFTYY